MHEKGIGVQDICNCVRETEPTKGQIKYCWSAQLLTTLVLNKDSLQHRNRSFPRRSRTEHQQHVSTVSDFSVLPPEKLQDLSKESNC